jgi:hypothetical protein
VWAAGSVWTGVDNLTQPLPHRFSVLERPAVASRYSDWAIPTLCYFLRTKFWISTLDETGGYFHTATASMPRKETCICWTECWVECRAFLGVLGKKHFPPERGMEHCFIYCSLHYTEWAVKLKMLENG